MPRFGGQDVGGFCVGGDVGGMAFWGTGGDEDLASWTDIISWREEGAPDM